jgi:hypothetical protein
VNYNDGAFLGGNDGAHDDEYVEGDQMHIKARGRLDVTGTTDTAVGEVGAAMSIYADLDPVSDTVMMDYAWGWWKMTPELTFSGGYNATWLPSVAKRAIVPTSHAVAWLWTAVTGRNSACPGSGQWASPLLDTRMKMTTSALIDVMVGLGIAGELTYRAVVLG